MSATLIQAVKLSDRLRALRKEQAKRQARQSLLSFIQYTRGPDYKPNWHHYLTCREIDDWLTADPPYNLMLSFPPQHGKSEICSRYLPPYLFGHNPDADVIAASYGSSLIEGMSRDAQRVIDTPEYHDLFPDTTLVRKGHVADETAIRRADEWTIQRRRGRYRCAGVGGGLTGHPAQYGIIDDPVKDFKAAESKTTRETVVEWYYTVFRTRLHGRGRTLMLLTRWHVDDLAGKVLRKMKDDPEADKWRQIVFPAIYEESLKDVMHPEDPRSEGQALWPEFQDEKHFAATRATIGSYHWHSLYQQRPAPPGGSRIKRSWINIIEKNQVPMDLVWVRFWDLAITEKTRADYSASVQLAIDDMGNVYVRNFIRDQQEWPVIRKMIIQQAVSDGIPVGVETSAQQKGFYQDLLTIEELRDIPLYGYAPDKSKLVRAQPWIARAEAGKFFVVRGPGLDDYIDELIEFTGMDDTHDDQVDATSGAYWMLASDIDPEVIDIGDYEF
jgi:predicted phage terminase large subunit-like protein